MAKLKKVDINQLETTFQSTDNIDLRTLGLSLVSELRFMSSTLESLKKEIAEKGVVTTMSQGKYSIERSNPAIASYNTMVKNYNSTIKQIYELLKPVSSDFTDDFENDDL